MPKLNPLIIGQPEIKALQNLKDLAIKSPVNMTGLAEKLKTPYNKAKHMKQMTEQSVNLPFAYTVTFSIEINHPNNRTARHMSMSSNIIGRMPIPPAVWMVAEHLGFVEGLRACHIWEENLTQGGAINIVQFVDVMLPSQTKN